MGNVFTFGNKICLSLRPISRLRSTLIDLGREDSIFYINKDMDPNLGFQQDVLEDGWIQFYSHISRKIRFNIFEGLG